MLGTARTPAVPRLAFVLFAGAFAASSFLPAQTFSNFPTPTAGGPFNITVGPDGNLWYTYYSSALVGRITPAGVITEFATAGNTVGITAGPDGALWFTENVSLTNQAKVGRITTAGTVTNEFSVPTSGASASQITTGPDGNLWFTEFSKGKIGRCTTAGVITEFDVPSGLNSEPDGIVSGPDGALWFAEFSAFKVGRITTAGIVTNEFPITYGGEEITLGPDGNLWVTEYPAAIGRVTPAGVHTLFRVPTQASGPRGITAGPDGALWFAEFGPGKIGRITTTGLFTEYQDPTAGVTPRGIVTGPDGALWFTNLNDSIGRLTAGTFVASSLTPSSGLASGVPGVVVGGAAFAGAATVTVGGQTPTSTVVNGATSITISTPSLAPGAVYPVAVTNPDLSIATIVDGWFADFLDVAGSSPFHPFVEKLVRHSITAGCGGGDYCPGTSVNRAQMAVFLLRSKDGPLYTPPNCSTPAFADVPCSSPFAIWVDELAVRGVTAGCGGGNYCPGDPVNRAQMAVFLLKTHDGPAYVPPACVTPTFADVPCSSPFARWVDELALRGITAGCGGGNYCPATPVTRGQMAVFLVTTFGLS